MELELGLAVLGVVAITATAVYLVSVMGIKEKSFEEAIAEQKKRSEDLLGRKDGKKKVVVKDKNKKQKKAKEKEKHHAPSAAAADLADGTDTGVHHHHHHHENEKPHHVEIVSEPEILDDVPLSNSRRSSFLKARETIKPILVNRDEHSPVVLEADAPPANHFEVIHPKGDLELKKQISMEDTPPATPPPPLPQRHAKKKNNNKEVVVKENGDAHGGQNESEWGYYENIPNPVVQEEVIEASQVEALKATRSVTPEEGVQADNRAEKAGASRSKRNKKDQEREEITGAKLENAIEKVPLSSSEIQNLIDILLNKQHAGDSEWINKGKNDSVSNLKKQLMERERQLSEEQMTVQTLQTKLKEIRHEFTTEKSKFAQIRRQLEDASNQKLQDVQQLQARLQQLRQEAIVEKQALQQKLQQMQISMNQLRDENVAVKSALSMEQGNRGKAESLEREAEALRTQCGHLENQLKAAFQSNQELSNQIRSLQEHLRVLEERKMQEEQNLHTSYASQMQERESHLVGELKKTQELLTEGEKERITLRQQNANLQNTLRTSQETAKAFEDTKKNLDDIVKSEKNTKNLLEDSRNQVVALQEQLQSNASQVQRLEMEQRTLTDQINLLSEQKKAVEEENQKLNGDIKSHQVTASGDSPNNNEELHKLQARLSEKEALVVELEKQTSQLASDLEKVSQDLQAQRDKNNELRAKNTKLMDTLSVTEKNLEARITQSELLVQSEGKKSRDEALQEVKSNLLKHFPQLSSTLNGDDWIDQLSKSIQDEIAAAKSQSQPTSANDSSLSEQLTKLQEGNAKLEEEVLHYQNVLASTENLLSNLQGSIEKEERKWHQVLQQKEAEINILKGQTPSVNTDTSGVQGKLDAEREEKSVLLGRCSELENNVQNLKKQLGQVETLRNTLEKVEEDLKEEKRKGTELVSENTRLQSVVAKEQESNQADREKLVQLQTELSTLKKQLSSDIASPIITSSATNGVANGKPADVVSPEAELVKKLGDVSSSAATTTTTTPLASPHASTSSTTSSSTTSTNAESPITSKESKPKKKKGASGRK